MTKADLAAVVRGFAPAIRDYVAAAARPLLERVVALEAREAVPGPPGPAGKDGMPGRDGLLDGISLKQIDERSWCLIRTDGTALTGTFYAPTVIDRGVYQAAKSYEKGDGVTYGGSFWIAQDETKDKPGDGATKWRLAVKCGRDGKDGKPGAKGDRGEPGRER